MGDARRPGFWRRIYFTPVSDLLRGGITGRWDLEHVIVRADLPADVEALIRRVVKRARLEPGERADVAGELVEHFVAALADGESAERAMARFGDVEQAARLIGRAKRNGRWYRRVGLHYAVHLVWALPVAYVVMGLLLLIGEPEPSVDYVAQINAAALAVPEDDRAWPLYRRALVEEGLREFERLNLYVRTARSSRSIAPGDREWPNVEAFLDSHRPLLETICEAAGKPAVGLPLLSNCELAPEDWAALYGPDAVQPKRPISTNTISRLSDESLAAAWPQHLGTARSMTSFLAADATLAAERQDSVRVVGGFAAMVGIANQVRETPQAEATSDAILGTAVEAILSTLSRDPGLLNRPQLEEIQHLLARVERWESSQLVIQQHLFLDGTQRMYTRGGRLTDEGLVLALFPSLCKDPAGSWLEGKTVAVLALPALHLAGLSRDAVEAEGFRLLWLAEIDGRRPLWEQIHQRGALEERLSHEHGSLWGRLRYGGGLPGLHSMIYAGVSVSPAERDILWVVTALELFRLDHGAYPAALDELVPRYLPMRAVDHSTGQPLVYRLNDGRPLLYGRGKDGDEDGGVREPEAAMFYGIVPERGDWVFFPPLIEPEVVEEEPEHDGYSGYGGYGSPPGYGAAK